MRELEIERFALDPAACGGHTSRHRIVGGVQAEGWGISAGVNWEAPKKVSNRIQYHIRKRLAVDRVPGRPVLAQAMELSITGYALKSATQTPWEFELQPERGLA